MKRKKIICCLLVVILVIGSMPVKGLAQEQQGANPFVLNPNRTIDNLEQLPAGAAARPDAVQIFNAGVPKYFWINNFGGRSTDYLEWTVQSNLEETTDYYAWLHISANANTAFKIEVTQGENTTETTYTKPSSGWDVAEFGTIKIPSGVSTIKLTKVGGANQNCQIKGLDIIRESDKSAYLDRVAAYRALGNANKIELSQMDYGLFFQYGSWGYPQYGPKSDLQTMTNEFDVDNFVDLLETVDAKFIIWSLTWKDYRTQMPVAAIDEILGHSDFTSDRNLVGEIAEECKSRGIKFFLYYHQGIQEEPTWKDKQDWPGEEFTLYGTGDRSTFINNWEKVITEIGNNLGENLDGWFFDDGCVYYPAPFERMTKAIKAGNENRLATYNPWVGTKVTEFQDMTFGENTWGEAADTTNGIFNSGREKGLLQVAQPMLNSPDWGVSSANEPINMTTSTSHIINAVKSAKMRNVPMALNIKMWEEGTLSDETMNALLELKNVTSGAEHPKFEWFVNNDDEKITYSEGWVQMDPIFPENYNSDIAKDNTSANPWLEYTFTGTGIEVVGNRDTWSKSADVVITNESGETVATGVAQFNGSDQKPCVGFSKKDLEKGTYKIKVTFKNDAGSEAHFDGFKVYNDTYKPDIKESFANNDDENITYSEGWTQTDPIFPENYNSDIAIDKTSANPWLEYTFTGTGIEVIGNRDTWSKSADVVITTEKGDTVATGVAQFNGSNQKPCIGYSKMNLEKGTYKIKLTFKNDAGSEAHFDGFKVYEYTYKPSKPEWFINNSDKNISFSEGWIQTEPIYNENYNSDIAIDKTSANPWLEYTFTGTGIDVIGNRADWSKSANVVITKESGETVASGVAGFYDSPDAKPFTGYSIKNLEKGTYTIKVTFNSDGSEAQFDAFKVYDNTIEPPEQITYPVTKVELSAASNVMAHSDTLQMKSIIKPQYATNKSILWSVTDIDGNPTSLATINEDGLLKGNGQGRLGKVMVTATSEEASSKSASMVVSIQRLPIRTNLYGTDDNVIRTGQWTVYNDIKKISTKTLGGTVEIPFYGNYIEWYGVVGNDHGRADIYIDNEYIATIDCYNASREDSKLLYRSDELELGNHTLKIQVNSVKNDYSTDYYVEVNKLIAEKPDIAVTGVTLNKAGASIVVGKTETLTATVAPFNAENKKITWSSSNGAVATVAGGVVKGVKAGTATITVTTEDGSFKAECKVTVVNPTVEVTAVKLNKTSTSIVIGKTEALMATVVPTNATNKTITWSSSDKAVATVSSTGVVKGIKAGKVTITATVGSKKATCTVTIKPAAPTSVKVASAGYNNAKVTWGKVSGASGYVVYRSTSKTGTYSAVKAVTSNTLSYTDTGLTTGKTYYYTVRAYATVGTSKVYGDYSSVVYAKPMLATATSVKAVSAGYDKVKVTWGKVTGASGYVLYYSTSKTGSYKAIKTITSGSTLAVTMSKLTTGKTYYFKIRPYRTVGTNKVYGNYTAVVYAKPIPAAPAGLKLSKASSTSIKAAWNKVSGASGYVVYRSTSKTGKYSAITTVSSKTLSYTNKKLTKGKTYYYKVRAYKTINSKKVYGSYSSVKSVKL